MLYVDHMRTKHEPDPTTEEAPKPYVILVTGRNGEVDPQLAESLEEYYKARDRDPNSWRNNPEKKRQALEGWKELIADYEAEFGAFTEEELSEAYASMYGK